MSTARYDVRYRVLGQKRRLRIWPGSSTAGALLISQGHTSSFAPVNVDRGELTSLP